MCICVFTFPLRWKSLSSTVTNFTIWAALCFSLLTKICWISLAEGFIFLWNCKPEELFYTNKFSFYFSCLEVFYDLFFFWLYDLKIQWTKHTPIHFLPLLYFSLKQLLFIFILLIQGKLVSAFSSPTLNNQYLKHSSDKIRSRFPITL